MDSRSTAYKHITASVIVQGVIISLIVSTILGIFGYIYNNHFSLPKRFEELKSSIDSLRTELNALEHDNNTVVRHFIQRPSDGISCKVGANYNNTGFYATVYPNNPHGLKNQDHITLFYNHEFGGSHIYVTIIVKSGRKKEKDGADIYLSEECLKTLGINKQEATRIGVFDMTYKIPE
ncbi:MAG: hypothetical protein HDS41_07305 [Bacteroides sp.]|nr:hypothetical protein [Bacteroides sp.]